MKICRPWDVYYPFQKNQKLMGFFSSFLLSFIAQFVKVDDLVFIITSYVSFSFKVAVYRLRKIFFLLKLFIISSCASYLSLFIISMFYALLLFLLIERLIINDFLIFLTLVKNKTFLQNNISWNFHHLTDRSKIDLLRVLYISYLGTQQIQNKTMNTSIQILPKTNLTQKKTNNNNNSKKILNNE